MKKHFSILLAAMIIILSLPMGIFTLFANAEVVSGNCGAQGDNLIWSLDTETGVLTISGNGDMKNYSSHDSYVGTKSPWVNKNGMITEIVFDGNIQTIGNYAFSGCRNLTSISIPNSVTCIGEGAFFYCSGITSIDIAGSVTSIGEIAFNHSYHLTSISIPNGVTELGDGIFYGCTVLANVNIGSGVNVIHKNAFNECSALESLSVDPNNSTYHSSGNCIIETATGTVVLGCENSVIPSNGSIVAIGENAFYKQN